MASAARAGADGEARCCQHGTRRDTPRSSWEDDKDHRHELLRVCLLPKQAPMVKPGDASMASPFTAKKASVMPCTDIIRQGRSTLVTTIQMFKILGLICLSTAYSLSVMYLQARSAFCSTSWPISLDITDTFHGSSEGTKLWLTVAARRKGVLRGPLYALLPDKGTLSTALTQSLCDNLAVSA